MPATLFERLIGSNLSAGSQLPEDRKMDIHSFCGALNELRRGKITGAEIATMFELDAAQQVQAIAIKDLIVAAPQKTEFMRVLKDCLYMGEAGDYYLIQSEFIARLQDEVTDTGGTLP